MSEGTSLLVPMEIRVLVTGALSRKKAFSKISYDYSSIGDEDPLLRIIEDIPFACIEEDKPGVRLHWLLPGGFTKGVQNPDSGKMEYPAVPNRWLVTRLAFKKAAGKLSTKSFLIQSDILQKKKGFDNVGSVTHPFIEDNDQPYRYLGRCLDPSSPEPSSPRERLRLTAVSLGNPFFAAHYHSCINVFALHDKLEDEDLVGCNIGYVVCGWYEDALGADPVTGISTPKELEESLGMSIVTDAAWPARTICHGTIGNIEWKGPMAAYPSGVPDEPSPGEPEIRPRLAIGNSSAEALAVLMAPYNVTNERICHIYLNDSNHSLVAENGISTTERSLHERAFTVIKPPDIVSIKRKENREDAKPPEVSDMDRISEIRKRQRSLFQDYNRFIQEQRAAYETWYLYTFANEDSWRLSYLACLRDHFEKLPVFSTKLETESASIESEVASFNLDGYTLEDEPDQRYYVPNEPVIVVSQPVHRADGGKDLLSCRISADIVRSLSLDIGGKTVSLDGAGLREELKLAIRVPDEIGGLVSEGLLLVPGFSEFLAERAYARAGIVPTAGQLEVLDRTIRKFQQGEFDSRGQPFSGVLPDDMAVRTYEPLWCPLFFEWEACYYPDPKVLQKHPDFSNWNFDGRDYTYTGPDNLVNADNERIIKGRMLISGNASRQFETMIQDHLPHLAAALQENPRQMSKLSQAFSGLHSRMLMREESLPLALFTADKSEKHIIDLISMFAPEVLGTKPVFDELYSPIRAGFLSLNRIRVIDTFGQFQEIKQPEYYVCESMRPPGSPPLLRYVMLPPRLLQPCRLLAYWTCAAPGRAGKEAGFVATASPVCGYLQANHIDHSLMVFSEDGMLQGSLNLVETGSGIIWKSSPGIPFSTELPGDMDPEMTRMLDNIRENGQACLMGLLEYIDTLFYMIHPPPHQAHEAELISRPLAVVRAAIKLEQLGKKEWYRHNEESRVIDPSHETDAESVAVPLTVGNREDQRDGMIGFFLNGNYGKLHIYGDAGAGADIPYFAKSTRIDILNRPDQPPLDVTFLMEPRCCVNLASGILPVEQLRLPGELVDKSLRNMCASYMAAPVICHEDHVDIPVPRMEGTNFEWNCLQQDTGWTTTVIEQKEAENFSRQGRQQAVEGFMQMVRRKEEV